MKPVFSAPVRILCGAAELKYLACGLGSLCTFVRFKNADRRRLLVRDPLKCIFLELCDKCSEKEQRGGVTTLILYRNFSMFTYIILFFPFYVVFLSILSGACFVSCVTLLGITTLVVPLV